NTEVTSNGVRLQDDEEGSFLIQVGAYLRLEHELDSRWTFFGELRSGYYREVSKAYDNIKNSYQELVTNAAFSEIQPSMYYKVSDRFKLGFGASLFFGVGMLQIEDQTGTVSDGVTFMK